MLMMLLGDLGPERVPREDAWVSDAILALTYARLNRSPKRDRLAATPVYPSHKTKG